MKRLIIIACVCAGLALSSCGGTVQQDLSDSTENASVDTMSSDSTAITTDTTSTGTDNSGNGGTDVKDTIANPQ